MPGLRVMRAPPPLQDATRTMTNDVGIIPIHLQKNVWAMRRSFTHAARVDELTWLQDFHSDANNGQPIAVPGRGRINLPDPVQGPSVAGDIRDSSANASLTSMRPLAPRLRPGAVRRGPARPSRRWRRGDEFRPSRRVRWYGRAFVPAPLPPAPAIDLSRRACHAQKCRSDDRRPWCSRPLRRNRA